MPNPGPDPADPAPNRAADRPLRVLLVEDELLDAEILANALRATSLGPYELGHHRTLASALEAIDSERHDVVLLDLSLPDSSGAETVERIAACRPGFPIVVVSGHEDEEWVAQMTQVGAHASLSKADVNPRVLARTIRESIERQRLLAELGEASARADYRATHDVLTGLPNRRLFEDRIVQALAGASRTKRTLALLLLDLDHFKAVNDTHGHAVGDELLRAIANRIGACVRTSDTAARLGGDEFAILLTQLRDRVSAATVAEQIHQALADPIPLAGGHHVATASIGIAIFPDDGQKVGDLFRNADLAMYHAKSQGRNRYSFYTEKLTARAVARLQLEKQLRAAIERREFLLEYQPQVDVASGTLVAAEALLRWRSIELGVSLPSEFLALAEETQLILPIGEWALHAACRQGRAWHADGHRGLRVNVNVSPGQLFHPGFVDTVRSALRESGLPPELLEIEIADGALTRDEQGVRELLEALAALGIHLSLDDFGTGYSRLATLRRLPIRALKIAPMFVQRMTHDRADETIVASIVRLARGLGIAPIAEGVESCAQRDALAETGCGVMQGYLLGRPADPKTFEAYFRSWRPA